MVLVFGNQLVLAETGSTLSSKTASPGGKQVKVGSKMAVQLQLAFRGAKTLHQLWH